MQSKCIEPHIVLMEATSLGAAISMVCHIKNNLKSYKGLNGVVELCRYKREDGVDLTATLYLPPNHDKDRDGPLPCLLWAYPREFKTRVYHFCLLLRADSAIRNHCLWDAHEPDSISWRANLYQQSRQNSYCTWALSLRRSLSSLRALPLYPILAIL